MVSPQLTGRVIKRYRLNKGLTQDALSGLAALDRTHYSKIERGLRNPTIETLFKISFALYVQPHVLVKAIEDELAAENDTQERKNVGVRKNNP